MTKPPRVKVNFVERSRTTQTSTLLATIGARIKAARVNRQMTHSELAQKLNVSRPTISMWESGVTKPSAANAQKIARVTGVPLEWLTERKGHDPHFSTPITTMRPRRERTATERANNLVRVAEIDPAMHLHVHGFDLKARAVWEFPRDVIERAFHASPGSVIIKQAPASWKGGAVKRGDYLLIDASHTTVDETGYYFVTDDTAVFRVQAQPKNGGFVLATMQGDVKKKILLDGMKVIGRVVGVIRSL